MLHGVGNRKSHAMYGNFLSFFLIEILDDALQAISKDGSDPKALLDNLKGQEDEDYKKFTESSLPTKYFDKDLNSMDDIPNDVIYRKPNLCHTARLPAEIRYQGILTESEIKGGYEKYDEGFELGAVKAKTNDPDKPMPLVWDAGAYKGRCTKYRVQIDYQNFFLANSYGESKLVLPNPSEKAAYGTDEPLHGFILTCLASCGWGCPKDTLRMDDLNQGGNFTMTVNGVAVQSFSPFEDCAFLKHTDGHKWTPNSNGQFEISAKTNEPPFYVRLSSFVIW
jgi:hypothetical protein